MAKATPDSVTRTSNQLHRHYERDYSGRPRHTCPLEPLERLIEKTRRLGDKARKLKGPRGREVAALVKQRLDLYQTERDAIAEARYLSPEVHEARALGQDADLLIGRYRRHFAGRDRRTRDTALLDTAITQLEAIRTRLTAILAEHKSLDVTAALNTVETQLEHMRGEAFAIADAVDTLDDTARAGRLGARANTAFDRFRVHFAGHDRTTCEPARLTALLAELDALGRAMAAAPDSGDNAANADIVATQAAQWRVEHEAITRAHADAPARQRIGALGGAANHAFALYKEHFAGHSRTTRNLGLLSDLCDRLGAIADQMVALDAQTEDPSNRQNLSIVRSRLVAYEQEFVAIANAKAQAAKEQGGDPLAGLIKVGGDEGGG